ncbi:pyroglutamyl-peptidase [Rosenbergiella nectarea]|uniref:Pyrrolidone-carboxylate peptidase n=1 Tax=Rosenbergiella nectarea TaxID=988801 RepID=A0A1H9DEF4_9GAMM|nr:pyroglutamyl-peptidase I [Rosenbergiella nectarea]SEQ11860.1 pyroglutamyl-peptidase [Rosenbergiella nectarea]
MKTVLLTGFEPFGDESINPSWEVVSRLEGVTDAEECIVCVQLPCVFGESLQVLLAAIARYSPTLVIAVGQAGGRTDISLERIAINIDDARIPDNQGYQPIDKPVVENGPAAWFSTLPIKAIVNALQQEGIPASVSQTAGTYVCNHVMYGLLHALGDKPEVKAGFMHIPYLPQQAAKHPGSASMAAETVKQGLEIAIRTALRVEFDEQITGGTMH